ncbi:MAG TPA: hypothetical protein VKG92_06055, partial [Flavobacteriales bacterium]|nr:hypothetical protein [Flavobacteriales bacterium]
MNAVKHSGCLGVPLAKPRVALSAASPRADYRAVGFPLQSLTRMLQLVFALLVLCPLANAQNPCPSEEVARDLVSQRLHPEKLETRLLVACDTAMLNHQLDKFIKHDRKYWDEGSKATIKLTPEEKTYLITELQKEN